MEVLKVCTYLFLDTKTLLINCNKNKKKMKESDVVINGYKKRFLVLHWIDMFCYFQCLEFMFCLELLYILFISNSKQIRCKKRVLDLVVKIIIARWTTTFIKANFKSGILQKPFWTIFFTTMIMGSLNFANFLLAIRVFLEIIKSQSRVFQDRSASSFWNPYFFACCWPKQSAK